MNFLKKNYFYVLSISSFIVFLSILFFSCTKLTERADYSHVGILKYKLSLPKNFNKNSVIGLKILSTPLKPSNDLSGIFGWSPSDEIYLIVNMKVDNSLTYSLQSDRIKSQLSLNSKEIRSENLIFDKNKSTIQLGDTIAKSKSGEFKIIITSSLVVPVGCK